MKKLLENATRTGLGPQTLALVGLVMWALVGSAALAGTTSIEMKNAIFPSLSGPSFRPLGAPRSQGSLSEIFAESPAKFEGVTSLGRSEVETNDFGATLWAGRDGGEDELGTQIAYLSEKFITHALIGSEIRGLVLLDRSAASGQSRVRLVELSLEAEESASETNSTKGSNSSLVDGSRNRGFVQAANVYSLDASHNHFQNSFVYVPLPPATHIGVLALGMIGLGHVRRNHRHKA